MLSEAPPAKYKLDDFKKVDKIGEGTYGVVYKARHKITGEMVAMKKIRVDKDDEGMPSTAVREVSMLRELRHPNIVDLKEVIMEGARLYLLFEFLDCDLKRFMDELPPSELFDRELLKSFTYQMTQGMLYCHQRRTLHRDLKPQNLLVDKKSNTIKLADFGLARATGIPARPYTHEVVTLWYRAPEILLGLSRYSMGVDVWSIGCIFAEMARRRPLFQGDSEIDQLFRVFKILTVPTEEDWPGVTALEGYGAHYHKFPTWTHSTLRERMRGYLDDLGMDLLEKTLIHNPADRITCKQMLMHPYFADLDKTQLPAGPCDGRLTFDDGLSDEENSENILPLYF